MIASSVFQRLCENAGTGIPPGRYGNAELMKIPNFLHLTPAHVKKHCAAIKSRSSSYLVTKSTSILFKKKIFIQVAYRCTHVHTLSF